MAYALAELGRSAQHPADEGGGDRDGPARHAALARAATAAVFERVEPELMVSQMPWLLLATDRPVPESSRRALEEMRRLVWSHQLIGPEVEGDDRDLAGGIVLYPGRSPAADLAHRAGRRGDGRDAQRAVPDR
ncbi:MAG: hypothetical protein KatS3mg103_0647 [Phycisphaerales bacterium]|nr:MAG: hypothetical protein KatS3mg103_0647 [Phycisphaerales bacterium]